MGWNVIERNWKQLNGRIKDEWAPLTDDDLDKIAGKREQLASRLVDLYGMSEARAEQEIDDWEYRMKIQKEIERWTNAKY